MIRTPLAIFRCVGGHLEPTHVRIGRTWFAALCGSCALVFATVLDRGTAPGRRA